MIINNPIRLVFVAATFATAVQAQAPTPPLAGNQSRSFPAVPVEPIAAIVEAFRTHAIVALGNVEFRGDEQSHAFQVSLIRDPRFTAAVNDVLVEFGNARYRGVGRIGTKTSAKRKRPVL